MNEVILVKLRGWPVWLQLLNVSTGSVRVQQWSWSLLEAAGCPVPGIWREATLSGSY